MNSLRKAAIQAYKERKVPRGVFAVKCTVTGGIWVDFAMDLDAAQNRVWFALKLRDVHSEKSAVEEFAVHGRDAFTYEILETFDDDVAQMSLRDLLKERKAHWIEKLGATRLSPM